ncbi:M3 family metallopeptidase [Agromyces sp. SYSU K20354]|uniref:M3 family metallopeptidase n=1 Tax=Agromyces cavernae TaxID=2898659 RepID=UPI001E414E90|nr:M3 family metallopeptidase [Agromyces cavernae]MCD2442236.1 M3 family metallopeptidase [Agromyces cavernae]
MTDDRRNPLLEPSPLPCGLPLFALIRPEHYREALELGMAEQRREVDAITRDPSPATFVNTIVALERSGALLRRVLPVFENASAAVADAEIDALETEFAPRLAAHHDAIRLDPRLFARFEALLEEGDRLALDAESAYLLERRHRVAMLAGAGLDDTGRAELAELNERIAALTTEFQQRLLADTNANALHIADEAELSGLDDQQRGAARAAAVSRRLEGWLFPLVLPTVQPLLAALHDPGVRDRLFAASRARGSGGGPHDTRETLLELVRARARRARLLGVDSHAAAVTADSTAGSPEAVDDLLGRLAPAARANARREAVALEARAARDGQRRVEASDWMYLTERVRSDVHEVDLQAMRPFFEFDRVLVDGVFRAATLLYGIEFTARTDLIGYHPDTRVYEVADHDGTTVGLYLLDPYARDSKRGGAWMSSLVDQSALDGTLPVVVNNLNVPKPAPGDPTLLTFDETETLFHEFGHAVHGLLARVAYPTFSGTNVFRDFVELPSQVNELWMLRPEIVGAYAAHHETGERMPQHVVYRLLASHTFNEGYSTTEYLAAAVLDQAWHRLSPDEAAAVTDVAGFERDALTEAGLDDPLIPPRYSSAYFAHIFAGGYDAGYYSYIWSEVAGADIMAWFEAHGGATRENGDRFRAEILAPGGSRDPRQSVRSLLGREPTIEPLLRRRGLV